MGTKIAIPSILALPRVRESKCGKATGAMLGAMLGVIMRSVVDATGPGPGQQGWASCVRAGGSSGAGRGGEVAVG